jgi:uncharacterized membrane protein YfcA
MCIIKWAEKKIKKLTFWDVGVLKLCLVVFGMVLGAYVANFVKQYVWWFVVVFAITYIYLLCKIFKK